MTGIGILGSAGRMGKAIATAVEEHDSASLAGGAGKGDDSAALAAACDVLIDFSAPDALPAHLEAAVNAGTPIVVGTTGLTKEHERALHRAAAKIPVLASANMSLGVNLLAYLVREAAARLGPDWDI